MSRYKLYFLTIPLLSRLIQFLPDFFQGRNHKTFPSCVPLLFSVSRKKKRQGRSRALFLDLPSHVFFIQMLIQSENAQLYSFIILCLQWRIVKTCLEHNFNYSNCLSHGISKIVSMHYVFCICSLHVLNVVKISHHSSNSHACDFQV